LVLNKNCGCNNTKKIGTGPLEKLFLNERVFGNSCSITFLQQREINRKLRNSKAPHLGPHWSTYVGHLGTSGAYQSKHHSYGFLVLTYEINEIPPK